MQIGERMKIAVLGNGVVGGGLQAYCTGDIECAYVLVREGKQSAPNHTSSIDVITGDSSVYLVAEALGGTEPALTYARAVISSGKHFVTANKELVYAHGIELSQIGRAHV